MIFNWTSVLALFLSMGAIVFHSEAFRIRACGRKLADVVQLVCADRGGLYSPDNHGHTKRMRKRSIFPVSGIVSECCLQSCTLSILHQYCQEPAVVPTDDDNEIENSRQYFQKEKYSKFKKLNDEDTSVKLSPDSKKKESLQRKPSIGYYVRDKPIFFARYS